MTIANEPCEPEKYSDWERQAVAGELIAIMNGEWFDFCRIQRVERALRVMRRSHGLSIANSKILEQSARMRFATSRAPRCSMPRRARSKSSF